MTSSTETPRPESEFSRSFVITMIVLTLLTLALFVADDVSDTGDRVRYSLDWKYASMKLAWSPYMIAGGHTIRQGLQEFSTATSAPVNDDARMIALLGLLVFYVCIPTVLLVLWRERVAARASGNRPEREGASYALLMVTGIFVALLSVGTIGAAVMQKIVFEDLRSAQAVQKNKDQIINTINDVMWRLRQHRALPASLGGGDGSYDGYALPPELATTPDCTVDLDIVPDDVTITAASTTYEGSSVGVIYTVDGITTWTYEGRFR